jgi:hypothetical protein
MIPRVIIISKLGGRDGCHVSLSMVGGNTWASIPEVADLVLPNLVPLPFACLG